MRMRRRKKKQTARALLEACLSRARIVARIYFNLKGPGIPGGRRNREGREISKSSGRSLDVPWLRIAGGVLRGRVCRAGWLEVWKQLGCEAVWWWGGDGETRKEKLALSVCLLQQESGGREGKLTASHSLLSLRFGKACKSPTWQPPLFGSQGQWGV